MEVTPSDGTEDGDSVASDTITISNTAPTAPEVSVEENGDCDDGWTSVDGEDRCFKAVFTLQNYSDAEANCVSLGGHLARISDASDNALALSLVYSSSDYSGPYTYTWIGGNRIDTSGDFEWTDGEDFDYTNWYTTEPTGAAAEQCIELFYPFDAEGRWNDDFCTESRHSVCQVPSNTFLTCSIDTESTDADGDAISYSFAWDVDGEDYTDATTTTETGDTVDADDVGYLETWTCEVTASDGDDDSDIGSGAYTTDAASVPSACVAGSFMSHDYLMCPTYDQAWDDANTRCQSMGYDGLVIIETAEEQSYLESLMPSTTTGSYYWIGMTDRATEGTFIWRDGTTLGSGYSNWDPTPGYWEPDSAYGDSGAWEDCAAWAVSGGYWHDDSCTGLRSYMCEAE